MDTPEKPKPPWRRKKRWWTVAALWLVVAYPLAGGPVFYGAQRYWWSWGAVERAGYFALLSAFDKNGVGYAYAGYLQWWREQAVKGEPGERWIHRLPVRRFYYD